MFFLQENVFENSQKKIILLFLFFADFPIAFSVDENGIESYGCFVGMVRRCTECLFQH